MTKDDMPDVIYCQMTACGEKHCGGVWSSKTWQKGLTPVIETKYTRPTAPNELAELRGILEGMRMETPYYHSTKPFKYAKVEAHNAALNLAIAEIDKMRGKGEE